tara:strand:- start:365 stop:535 length:171 start_codon:yes stop_codon:yes gene_type:complete
MKKKFKIVISESAESEVEAENLGEAIAIFESQVGSAEEFLEEYGEFTYEVIPPEKA